MSSLLKLVLIAGVIFLVYMMLTNPRQIRALGRRARLVVFLWVIAILIGAFLRIAFGWPVR